MIQFFALKFFAEWEKLEIQLQQTRRWIRELGDNTYASRAQRHDLFAVLTRMETCCEETELTASQDRIRQFKKHLGSPADVSLLVVESEISGLQRTVCREFGTRKFAFIPSEQVRFIDQKTLFGEHVDKAFPAARLDIKEAGNCLALDLNTAAVFHLMRVAEIGLRSLAAHLRVSIKKGQIQYLVWCNRAGFTTVHLF